MFWFWYSVKLIDVCFLIRAPSKKALKKAAKDAEKAAKKEASQVCFKMFSVKDSFVITV